MDSRKMCRAVQSVVFTLALSGMPAFAQQAADEGWKWGAEVYFWGASLGGRTTSGDDVDLGIDDIIKDLKMGAMGALSVRRDKVAIFTDLIYLDVGDSEDFGPARVSLDLKGIISTSGIGYQIYENSSTTLDITGGFRVIWLDSKIKVRAGDVSESASESGTNWDGVVGLRGKTDLNDKWYLAYYADVGAGESDFTWQALAAVNYSFEKLDVAVGYRYIDWEFDDFGPFDSLDLSGPFAGVKFWF